MRPIDRCVERGETIEHRLEVREADIRADEEAQRRIDLAESAGDLHQRAEQDLAEKIERRADDEGEVLAHLVVAGGEGGQPLTDVDDAHVIVEHVAESAHGVAGLDGLAAQQRDLLAVFAQTGQTEAEVRLVLLLAEIERDQRMADPMGEPGADRGVDERDPEQQARHDDGEAGERELRPTAPTARWRRRPGASGSTAA